MTKGATIRRDVQILRGYSVLAVVFYHADFLGFKSGFIGVDIFFVISGFLIIGKISRELAAGTFQLLNFWERRIRRLLPASFVVVLITLLFAPLFLTKPDFMTAQRDALFSSLNLVNWHFANQNTDYWSATQVSPFLHFWSLSVEEQFYILTPIALIASWSFLSLINRPKLPTFNLVLFAISGVSFLAMLLPIWDTSSLYFNSFTRVWEFTLGGVTALLANRQHLKVNNALKAASIFGLIGLSLLPHSGTYPGPLTLIPVFLTCLYLWLKEFKEPKTKASEYLSGFFERIGDYSYSIYLWHWPITVYAFSYIYGADFLVGQTSISSKLFVIAASFIAGWMSFKFIETPTRSLKWNKKGFQKWIALSVASFVVILGTQTAIANTTAGRLLPSPAEVASPAANNLNPSPISNPDFAEIFANQVDVKLEPANPSNALDAEIKQMLRNRAEIYKNGCHLESGISKYATLCEFGDLSSTRSVMLIGDSHAANWFPAINSAAGESNFKLLSRTKSSCGLLSIEEMERPSEVSQDCLQWRRLMLQEIERAQPELVVVSQMVIRPENSNLDKAEFQDYNQQLRVELVRELQMLSSIAKKVLFIDDIPQLSFDPKKCLETFSPDSCTSNRESREVAPSYLHIEKITNLKSVNFNDLICAQNKCSATNSKGIVYRDSHHLTEAFSRSLAPVWARVLGTYSY
jgi:peptidoglycan/LPS O-acetylase OafA/YrhL